MKKITQISTTLALILVTLLWAFPSMAQQTTGVPGSPSATTSIDGKQLPPPDPKFGGVIDENATQSKRGGRRPWCRPRARPTCS